MSDFDLELQKCFLDEAKELVADAEGLLLELERSQDQNGKPKSAAAPASDGVIIVVTDQQTAFGILVDDVIGQQPIVIRKLGEELAGSKGCGGGVILGDGQPALILDVKTLYELHRSRSGWAMSLSHAQPKPREVGGRR